MPKTLCERVKELIDSDEYEISEKEEKELNEHCKTCEACKKLTNNEYTKLNEIFLMLNEIFRNIKENAKEIDNNILKKKQKEESNKNAKNSM